MTWPCLKHFKTVYVGLSWSTLLEHGIVWIVTIVTSLCHLSLGIARSRCKLAGCSWSSKQQISQILSCSQMVFHTVMDVMANIVKHLCFVHVPSWMPLLDFWYFCTWCLQHLTVPLRVWGPAQTAAASTSDASTSTSYGRLGPYRQSTCDILRPFVTFCDHLWPLRKKRWLFSDYSVTIYMMTIYDYLVNLVTTLRFRMFHMFHAIDDQSADNVKVTSSKRWIRWVCRPVTLYLLCCLGLFVEVLEIWRNHYWIRRNPKESEGIQISKSSEGVWSFDLFAWHCLVQDRLQDTLNIS